VLKSGMARHLTSKQHLEDAELRVQRAQRRLDRQREGVAALERTDEDAGKAKRYLRRLWPSMSPIGAGQTAGRPWLINYRP
jgi:hypothetical protein